MRSNSQQSNGLDALFKFMREKKIFKKILKPSQHLFSIIDLAKWALFVGTSG
jgi:hypothetical protein